MKAMLVIPAAHSPTRRFRLTPRAGRNGEVAGFKISPVTICRVLTRLRSEDLRDALGVRIETDDITRAAEILRLTPDEPSLILHAP